MLSFNSHILSDDEQKISKRDLLTAAAIFVFCLFYAGLNLSSLEFFRHTEADRALIAWEMFQSGNYLVPHLLGDLYLTKPPLYYWIVAFTFYVTGTVSEWSARYPSAYFFALLVSVHFLFLRSIEWSQRRAIFGSMILFLNIAFFQLSVLAEIDMTFITLCSFSLYLGFLSFYKDSKFSYTILAYLFAALAFLTKGPQILLFFGSGIFFYFGYQLYSTSRSYSKKKVVHFLLQHIVGGILFLSILALWIFQLSKAVGLDDLYFHFNHEVIDRFTGDNRGAGRIKPFYYYIGSLIGGMLPSSLFALGFLVKNNPIRKKDYQILIFALAVALPSLLILSASAGKASRYIAPTFPLVSILLAIGAEKLAGSKIEGYLKRVLLAVCLLTIASPLVLPWAIEIQDISSFIIASLAISLPFLFLLFQLSKESHRIVIALVLCLFAARIPFDLLYSKVRNATRSCKPAVEKISAALPQGESIYVLELFDRWVPYYLKQKGVETYRITPKNLRELEQRNKVFLLVNTKEENWRLEQLKEAGTPFETILETRASKAELALLKVPASFVRNFKPERIYPTISSYTE